jgi:molybdopterin synthase sulfur carrier subunit
MSVTLKLNPSLSRFTDGKATVSVEGDTVGKCLDELVKQFPALKPRIVDNNGTLRKNVNIFIDRKSVRPQDMAKPVRDGEEILITMMIGGG